jgi:fumarylacetoacetase
MLNETHDPQRRSIVSSANGHPWFPIQNLPLGVFSLNGGERRLGTAIGDEVLDLSAAAKADLLDASSARVLLAAGDKLNGVFSQPPQVRNQLRAAISKLLSSDSAFETLQNFLHPSAACTMHVPAKIGGYTDFYTGINHALNVGRLFRPDNPLLPNYKYVPIGYHGRTSSIVISGEPIERPSGQRKLPSEAAPTFGPCRNLDYELELGFWIAQGNRLSTSIPIKETGEHIAGVSLLNDWSARDIQAWEYQPLGPFLSKNFATTISPWVVTIEALAPYRCAQAPRPQGDPTPLPYLLDENDQSLGALDISLEVYLVPSGSTTEHKLSSGSSLSMYWTPAQLIAHHTCGGCNLEPGDLLGSGTLSGETPQSAGSLLEITGGGQRPLQIASDVSRTFLNDGDTIIFRGHCQRDGFASIGFGECRGTVRDRS